MHRLSRPSYKLTKWQDGTGERKDVSRNWVLKYCVLEVHNESRGTLEYLALLSWDQCPKTRHLVICNHSLLFTVAVKNTYAFQHWLVMRTTTASVSFL